MYIQIVGDTTKYQGNLERIGLHLIKVSGLIQHTSGFRLYLDNGTLVGDYSNFVYPYLDPNLGEGVYEYSDNNMSYDDEIIKPDRKEEERQNIMTIVTQTVGEELALLSQEVVELSNILAPMYEAILDIQEALQPQEEFPTIDEVPNDNVDTVDTQPIDDEIS